jgi:hypothetical protein
MLARVTAPGRSRQDKFAGKYQGTIEKRHRGKDSPSRTASEAVLEGESFPENPPFGGGGATCPVTDEDRRLEPGANFLKSDAAPLDAAPLGDLLRTV